MHDKEMLEYGRRLVAAMHRDYESIKDEFEDEHEAYYHIIEEVGMTNFDWLAVMWAAGVVSEALGCESVCDGIEEAIVNG